MTSSNLVGCTTGRSAGLRAFQDAADILASGDRVVGIICAVGEQATDLSIFAVFKDRWDSML